MQTIARWLLFRSFIPHFQYIPYREILFIMDFLLSKSSAFLRTLPPPPNPPNTQPPPTVYWFTTKVASRLAHCISRGVAFQLSEIDVEDVSDFLILEPFITMESEELRKIWEEKLEINIHHLFQLNAFFWYY